MRNEYDLFKILKAPHVSEKMASASEHRQYAFRVCKKAEKPEIKQAIEQLFKVKIASIRVCNQKGKRKRAGRVLGKKSDWKKAYITLEEGQEINLGVGE
ncbi:MAG TPA: 50S ribosomal protein L23 [Coxiellaceae bacterium]|nr:50S ribosomal protein L23 [Coxiellaceae bacterium]